MVAKIDPGTAAAQQNGIPTPLNCPRCDSANTKFCYYNNYSLSQPRHFCKSCKRYWTRGGTLRNVPVGGGSRKNKRAKKHHRSAEMSAAADPSLPPPPIIRVTSTDFNSLFYGLPATNSATVSLPKFDLDAQLAGYEGKYFQPCLGANLLDLQKLTASPKFFLGDYSLLTSQIPSSSSAAASAGAADGYRPLISFDEFPIETTHEINTSHRSIECQFIRNDNPAEPITSFAASVPGAEIADSSYLYWNNQAVSGGWPESGSSSMAPLF